VNAASERSEGRLIVTGAFDISLTEFHIERPSLLLIPENYKLSFTIKQVFNL